MSKKSSSPHDRSGVDRVETLEEQISVYNEQVTGRSMSPSLSVTRKTDESEMEQIHFFPRCEDQNSKDKVRNNKPLLPPRFFDSYILKEKDLSNFRLDSWFIHIALPG